MWTLDSRDWVPLWRPADPDSRAALAFTTRRGGVSDAPYDTLNLGRSTEDAAERVERNRAIVLERLELSPRALATAGQVHGIDVTEVSAPGLHPSCDALITRTPGIALAVSAADCVPLLLAAPNAVGAVHSGWRGTAAGAPRAAVAALSRLAGAPPASISVHIGPSIRVCCYSVGAEVAGQFPDSARVRSESGWRLDLVTAARHQLLDAGIRPDAIHVVPACTACEPYWYFSHRATGPRTGRQWGLAALRPQ